MTRRTFLKKESGDILQFAFKNTGNIPLSFITLTLIK